MTRRLLATVVITSLCATALAGCGRKGPLEPPPSSMVEDEHGKMVEKPKVDKPFILDRLIK